MTTLFIPQSGSQLELLEDWQVTVNWWKRNLRMLAKFKLTGMKEVDSRTYAYYDVEQNKYVPAVSVRRETVPNPLFMDYEGNYAPVQLTFPAGTIFTLSRYNYSHSMGITSIDLKCAGSPKMGIKGLCLQLAIEDFNGVQVAVSE